jgi:glycosyltransferase involved in cell wall biosynthesis
MTAMENSHERGAPEEMSATISVVIPTRNRPERVIRAVRSALDQSLPPHDVVVVVDGPDFATVRALEDIGDSRVAIVELAENGGAARARNIGISNCTGDWVAFLDDDDEWLPGKLRAQALSAASEGDIHHLVLGTGVEWKGDSTSEWWPLRSPSPQERISDYLFVRRRRGEGLLATPTIMLRREFALACPFPEHLRILEDFDWLIELEKAGARFLIVLEPLVIVNAPSARTSLSSDAHWETSLAWALSRKSDMSQRAFSDFCLTVSARLARATGGLRAETAVFFVASTGRLSWFSTARFLAIGLLPTEARRRMAVTASTTIRHMRQLVPK